MQKRRGSSLDRAVEVDGGDDDEEEDEEVEAEDEPQKVVQDENCLQHQDQDIQAAQIEDEMEEGEVDEDDSFAELTHASQPNGDVNVSVVDGNKRDPQPIERWPENDINAEAAPGTITINSTFPRPLKYDGLAQYGQAKDSLTLAKESLLARVRSPTPAAPPPVAGSSQANSGIANTDHEARAFATLDMIVTIVGEFYGQKDLLDAREVWGE